MSTLGQKWTFAAPLRALLHFPGTALRLLMLEGVVARLP
jgi:hypothetical protein